MFINGKPISKEKGLVAVRREDYDAAIARAYEEGYAAAQAKAKTEAKTKATQTQTKPKAKTKLTVNGNEAEFRATVVEK